MATETELSEELFYEEEPENASVGFCFTCRHRSNLFLFFYLVVLIIYICIGAMTFSLLEQPLEFEARKHMEGVKAEFLRRYSCINATDFNRFMRELDKSKRMGVTIVEHSDSGSNWNFIQSMFFCVTVLTTIGYGKNTPLSDTGKVVCIFFGLIGIPLTIVMFTALAERIYSPVCALREAMRAKLEPLGHSELRVKLLHFVIYSLIIAIVFFFIPAAVFQVLEPGWHYLDGLYFSFISLTTVGLGDYVPAHDPDQSSRDVYKFAVVVYLLVGLTFVILCVRLAGDLPELHPGRRIYPGDTGARSRFNSLWTSTDLPTSSDPDDDESRKLTKTSSKLINRDSGYGGVDNEGVTSSE